jgi:alpha-beta hydrolase superfamily lysophospholipase
MNLAEPAAGTFAVGYHTIHPDVSLNYQMNRFSTGRPDTVADMKSVAPRIRDYTDYVREFLNLSERALAQGMTLEGANYLRSAEFFMFPDDPRKHQARANYLQLMKQHFRVRDEARHRVPYASSKLSAYRFTHATPHGTVVLFGGFDSYIEELFPIQLYLRDAGFDVIAFEGPGQGTVLEDEHLPMTADWDKPVGAVLDYFATDDVTLIGYSLGGGLAIRAAAREPRVSRVVADDIFTDLFEVSLRQQPPAVRATLSGLIAIGAAPLVNALTARAMKRSLAVEWGVRQGMHITGATTPYGYLKQAILFRTHDVSPLVKQDVLLLAAAEDHYVPLHQFYDQMRWLTGVRSLTSHLFTRSEHAQNHVHIGNVGLSLRVIVDWIVERQRESERAVRRAR